MEDFSINVAFPLGWLALVKQVPNARQLGSWGSLAGLIDIWNMASGEPLGPKSEDLAYIETVRWSAHDKYITRAGNVRYTVWYGLDVFSRLFQIWNRLKGL